MDRDEAEELLRTLFADPGPRARRAPRRSSCRPRSRAVASIGHQVVGHRAARPRRHRRGAARSCATALRLARRSGDRARAGRRRWRPWASPCASSVACATACGTWTRRRPCSTACRSRACSYRRAYVLGHLLARFEESAADLRRARELFSGVGRPGVGGARAQPAGPGRRQAAARSSPRPRRSRASARSRPPSATPFDVAVADAQHRVAGLPAAATCPRALERYADGSGALRRARHDQRRPRARPGARPTWPAGSPTTRSPSSRRHSSPDRCSRASEADLLVAVAEAALAAGDWDRARVGRRRGSSAAARAVPARPPDARPTCSSITAREPGRRAAAPACCAGPSASSPGCARRGRPELPQALLARCTARRAGSGRRARPASATDWLAEAATSAARPPAPSGRSAGWRRPGARELAGDSGGVLRACELGLRALDEHRATLGSQELRAGSAGHGAALAELGTRTALAGGDARQLLRWSERWRATALATPVGSARPRRGDHRRPGRPARPAPTPGRGPRRGSAHRRARGACRPGSSSRCASACSTRAASGDGCRGPRRRRRSSRRSPRTTRSSSSWPRSTASCTRSWRVAAAYATGVVGEAAAAAAAVDFAALHPAPGRARAPGPARGGRRPARARAARAARWTAWGSRASSCPAPLRCRACRGDCCPSLAAPARHQHAVGAPVAAGPSRRGPRTTVA